MQRGFMREKKTAFNQSNFFLTRCEEYDTINLYKITYRKAVFASMFKIGISSASFEFSEETFRELKESGTEAIEVSMTYEKEKSLNYKEVRDLSERYQLRLWSYHLPYLAPTMSIDISALEAESRDNAIRYFTELIGKGSDIGIDKFVIHPSREPIPPSERADRLAYSMEYLDKLAEIAHRHGAVLAVEDLPRTCLGNTAEEMLLLLTANSKLRVCFDMNHLLIDNNVNFMEKLGDKIITLHVSDYDFIDEKHWLPGEGLVDWVTMAATLNKIGYNGVWMYEVKFNPSDTMPRSRPLTFADLTENARQIFAGTPPTRIL